MLNVIRPVPCRMAGAEAFFHVARRGAQMNRRSVGHRGTRKEPFQIRSDVAQPRTRNSLLVLCLDCGRCADKIIRNPEANSEMMREIVAPSKRPIVYRPVTARTALESRPQAPAWIEPCIRLRGTAGCRILSLRMARIRRAN